MSEKSYEFGNWTLKEILTDKRLKGALFRIPDYQRGYAWGRRQREEFWEDLLTLQRNDKSENAAESDSGKKGKSHYMGAITVERKKDEGGHPVYEVVDGQQRLTTIAILLSVLGGHEFCSRFSYGESNENHDFFQNNLNKPSFSDKPSNFYQKNLVDAKSFFAEKVGKLDRSGPSAEDIKAWVVGESEEGRLEFDFRILRQDHNAGIIFETMNNRGKPLTLLEKLKNRLMYLTEIAAVEDESDDDETPIDANELREKINNAWGKIYEALTYKWEGDSHGEDEFVSLDEDEFVAAHLSVYRNPKESVYSEAVAESRLFKMFCEHPEEHPISEEIDERQQDAVAGADKERQLSISKINEYVDDLRGFAPAWTAIHREYDSACGQCRLLSDRRETKIFLVAVALHVQDESLRETIYKDARKILFRNTIGAGMDRTRFATLARRLHGVCVDQLKRGQRKQLDGKGVLLELRSVLDNEKKKPTKTTLVEFFAGKKRENDFYGWSELAMRYFLMCHEEDYPGPDEKTKRRLTWKMFEKVSVEHVLPQSSATKDSRGWRWWKPLLCDWLKQKTGNDNPTDDELEIEAEMLSGTLGNLTLLTRDENSKISNRPWNTYPNCPGKQDFYLDTRNCSSNGAVALADGATQGWNAWRIRERGRNLFRKLAEDFEVEGELSDSEVDKALGFQEAIAPNGKDLLSDALIPKLSDEIVSQNVQADNEEDDREKKKRQWNAMPTDERKRLYFDFWTQFREWCKENGKTWCTGSVRARYYYDLSRKGMSAIHLFFTATERSGSIHNEGSLVTIGIYCHDGEEKRKAIQEYQEDFNNAFAASDCPPDFQDWDYGGGSGGEKRILFIRKADWKNADENLFARMAADYETVRKVLVEHGERL